MEKFSTVEQRNEILVVDSVIRRMLSMFGEIK